MIEVDPLEQKSQISEYLYGAEWNTQFRQINLSGGLPHRRKVYGDHRQNPVDALE